jgi:hypothetical protein
MFRLCRLLYPKSVRATVFIPVPAEKDAKKALSYVETDAYRKKFNETLAWLS